VNATPTASTTGFGAARHMSTPTAPMLEPTMIDRRSPKRATTRPAGRSPRTAPSPTSAMIAPAVPTDAPRLRAMSATTDCACALPDPEDGRRDV